MRGSNENDQLKTETTSQRWDAFNEEGEWEDRSTLSTQPSLFVSIWKEMKRQRDIKSDEDGNKEGQKNIRKS